MPIGTAKEFAAATGRDHGNVYRAIRDGKFNYPDAELVEETVTRFRVRWKKPRSKPVNRE